MGCFHPTQTAGGMCRESKPEAPPWSLFLTWLAQHTQGSSSSPSSQLGTAGLAALEPLPQPFCAVPLLVGPSVVVAAALQSKGCKLCHRIATVRDKAP